MSTTTPPRSITRNPRKIEQKVLGPSEVSEANLPSVRFPEPELEALQETVRWTAADPRSAMVLAGQLLASRRDQDGYDYFRERAAARPDEPLFTALEGLFQARLARLQALPGRLATVQDALRKLDDAVSHGPGVATYLRGIVLAEVPPELGLAETAVADLEWVLAARKQFPSGLRRNANRALARAYSALGREAEAKAALERSGYAAAGPDEPVLVTDSWLTARDGFRFVPPRLMERAPGVYVAQGYDFGDFAFVETGDGIVAIDAGTADANVHAALRALREITAARSVP